MMPHGNIPASPSTLDDNLDVMGFGDSSTVVSQIDKGLHPDGEKFIELIVKSRITGDSKPFIDHILSRAIQTGKFQVPVAMGKKLNAAEALALADAITGIALRGEARNEFTKVLSGFGNAIRAPFRFMGTRRQTSYGNTMV